MTTPLPGTDFPFTVWDVVNMSRKLDDLGTVDTVYWTATRFKDGEQANDYGSISLKAPELGTGIPYTQLTKETVVSWVTSRFGAEKIAAIEAALDQLITEKLTPTHSAGVPWG